MVALDSSSNSYAMHEQHQHQYQQQQYTDENHTRQYSTDTPMSHYGHPDHHPWDTQPDEADGPYVEQFDDIHDGDSSYADAPAATARSTPQPEPDRATTSTTSKRKKITRIRPLRSCLSCNRRKIKCDRETPCGPCSKRGEGDACSLVAGLSASHLTNSALAERLAHLEARVEDLEAGTSQSISPAPVANATSSSTHTPHRSYALAQGRPSADFTDEKHSSRLDSSVHLPHPPATSSLTSSLAGSFPPGYSGKLAGHHADNTATSVGPRNFQEGYYPHNDEGFGSGEAATAVASSSSSNKRIKQSQDDFVTSTCETEEAALALESLCRTEDVLERSELANTSGLKSSRASFSLPVASTSTLPIGSVHSRAVSSMSMGNILNPPSTSSSSTGLLSSSFRTSIMSPEERQYRSSIIVDPTTSGGINSGGHRLQRSLDTRLRIFTSPNFPKKEFCDHVVWSYFRHLDPLWHVHIGWLFDDEYKEFWKLRGEARHVEVDPAWGALLFMTLALGLQVTELPLPQHLLPHPSATSSDILALADSYISDVEELLNAANWARTPQLRVLQTLALFSAFQSMHSLRDPITFTMNGAGVRIAQILGLHDLGDAEHPNPISTLLADDIAVPTGNQPLKDHLARMLWHTLVVLELVHVTRAGIDVPLASTPYTTHMPNNVDDADFQNLPLDAAAGSVKSKAAWQLTSVSSLHLRSLLSRTDKRLLDLPASMKATEKYTHVMNIDAELRKWISASPIRQAAQNDYASYKLSQWQHWSLMADVHGAIVHAHRPYMTRGYVDPRFSFSTKTCLESAKVLCESWQHLRDYITDQRFWWTTMRYLSAALVIFIDLFIAMDNGCPEEVLATKRTQIPLICDILQERMSSLHSTTSMFAAAAFGVVSNLLEAEKAKKAAMIARRNSADGTMGEEVEPVGRVFKRIAQNMTSGGSSTIKAESSAGGLTSSSSTTQPSPIDGVQSVNNASGASLTEQPTFAQPANTKRSGKQSRRASMQASDPARNVKNPKLSPTHSGPLPSTSVQPVYDAHMQQNMTFSPNLQMPALTSSSLESTPSFAMDSSTTISRHDSYNSVASGNVPWLVPGQHAMEEPQQQPNSYSYSSEGHYVASSAPPHVQHNYPHGYDPQVQAPISWDTSGLFHPDPSVLLQSMGFPAAQHLPPMGYSQPEHGHSPALQDQSGQFAADPNQSGSTMHPSWYSSTNTSHY